MATAAPKLRTAIPAALTPGGCHVAAAIHTARERAPRMPDALPWGTQRCRVSGHGGRSNWGSSGLGWWREMSLVIRP